MKVRITHCGRTCTKCGKWKHWKSFSPNHGGSKGRKSRCQTCCAKYKAAWKKRTGYESPYYYNPSDNKFRSLYSLYKLTRPEFDSIYKRQHGKCAICRRPIRKQSTKSETRRSAFVDHDHKTGRVRGLLCQRCNCALGLFQDDPKLLKRAILHVS